VRAGETFWQQSVRFGQCDIRKLNSEQTAAADAGCRPVDGLEQNGAAEPRRSAAEKKGMTLMPRPKSPDSVSNSTLATVYFTKSDKPTGYGHGFVVRFAVPPRNGDLLTVDQYSIRQIPNEDLHQTEWKVVQVRHAVNLDPDVATQDGAECPLATLEVTVHPVKT